ncbi:MAG: hypothetical protein BV457_06610, partial [Thermoplasmata archaeon M9B1D]
MIFDLKAGFTFSNDLSKIKKELESFISNFNKKITTKDKTVKIQNIKIEKNNLFFSILSDGIFRPHNVLLQMKNEISKEFGKSYHLGVREIKIEGYNISFDLEKKPLKDIKIPFAEVKFKEKTATLILKDIDEEFLQHNYIDRMINRVNEKVENQY